MKNKLFNWGAKGRKRHLKGDKRNWKLKVTGTGIGMKILDLRVENQLLKSKEEEGLGDMRLSANRKRPVGGEYHC